MSLHDTIGCGHPNADPCKAMFVNCTNLPPARSLPGTCKLDARSDCQAQGVDVHSA